MGDSGAADAMNQRLDEQQSKADADVESRRKALAHSRLQIIRQTGQPEWRNSEQPNIDMTE